MWNRRAVFLVFFISLYQVTSSYDVKSIVPTFDPTKVTQLRNVSTTALKSLIKKAKELLESSLETERADFLREVELMEAKEGIYTRSEENLNLPKKRVKRQGKFAQAAKMTNLKAMRIYLTLFKNLWAKTYVGGAHPLHPDVPKPVVILFKQKIMEFFFPPIGDDAIKE